MISGERDDGFDRNKALSRNSSPIGVITSGAYAQGGVVGHDDDNSDDDEEVGSGRICPIIWENITSENREYDRRGMRVSSGDWERERAVMEVRVLFFF